MCKFATTVLISLISSLSASAVCHLGQRLLIKPKAHPHKHLYVLRPWNRAAFSPANDQGQS